MFPISKTVEQYEIILGSGSPQRSTILAKLIPEFVVKVSEFPETIDQTKISVQEYVLQTALGKRDDLFMQVRSEFKNPLLICADTIVVVDNQILEKPLDDEHAAKMLARLSGREHLVLTAVCIKSNDKECSFIEETKVLFGDLSKDLINAYIETGDHKNKAGSWGYQSLGGIFVKGIQGCSFNVVGLPLYRLNYELEALFK
jgi:septum formation protein